MQNVEWVVGPIPDGILNLGSLNMGMNSGIWESMNSGSLTLLATIDQHVDDGSHATKGFGIGTSP